jgi:lipoyl(octanoyl) transferase
VEALSCRVVPYAEADGATNMAADEVLVRGAAARGTAALRCYGWTTATVSLGYFQPAAIRANDPRLAGLPWVRRPSGGGALVHHHELTYALAVPPGAEWRSSEPWMARMHRIIARALADFGLGDQIEPMTAPPSKHGDVLCFQQYTRGDLLCGGRKVVGSAQRKYHQALLQHGSLLLAQSEFAPALPGLRELIGAEVGALQLGAALVQAVLQDTGWKAEPAPWSADEEQALADVAGAKYATAAWNERR